MLEALGAEEKALLAARSADLDAARAAAKHPGRSRRSELRIRIRGGVSDPKAVSTLDPATLALTGWWRGSYDGSGTWSGTASAGSSGTRSLVELTNKPSSGTAVNGFNPATFDGVNDKLGAQRSAPT